MATTKGNPTSTEPTFTFKVTESKTPFVQGAKGRAAAPNPLLPHVETAVANQGKSYDVTSTNEKHAKAIVSLLRRASEKLNVSLRIQVSPDFKNVKFEARGARIKRTRKPKVTSESETRVVGIHELDR